MIPGQTQIVTAETQDLPKRPCQWCGEPTKNKLELEPARYGIDKLTGVRVVKKFPIVAYCCDACDRRLERSERVRKQEAREVKKAGGPRKPVIK